MQNARIRLPITLDISVSLDDDYTPTAAHLDIQKAAMKKWQAWPKNAHETMVRGEWLLVRFLLPGETTYTFEVAYFDGWNLMNSICQTLFLPEGCAIDELEGDEPDELVHFEHQPEDLVWIPLVDILTEIEG